jgi:hypothetical protein
MMTEERSASKEEAFQEPLEGCKNESSQGQTLSTLLKPEA